MCKIHTCRASEGEVAAAAAEEGWGRNWRTTEEKVEVSGAQGLAGGGTEGDVE